MRDASLFLLKNSLGSKMKKGLRNFCTDDGSTSTLNQNGSSRPSPLGLHHLTSSSSSVPVDIGGLANSNKNCQEEMERQPTLEEMILKLDLEEEIARKSKTLQLMKETNRAGDQYNIDVNGLIMRGSAAPGRMSCVNNSDILRSARNALNQYPRFSLDGRDSMYRSSFRNSLHLQHNNHISSITTAVGSEKTTIPIAARRSSSDTCSSSSHGYYDASSTTTTLMRPLCRRRRHHHLPATLAGESVVWCKPGIVAKLMGLDAMPVPSQQNMITMRRRGDQRRESGKRSSVNAMDLHDCSRFDDNNYKKGKTATTRTTTTGSCSAISKTTAAGNYCVMKPVVSIHHSDNHI